MIRGARGYFLYGLGFFVVLELMIAAAIYWWPSFEDNIDGLKAFATPLPMLGAMLDEMDRGGVAAYVAGQHFFKGCSTLGTASAILFAAGAVAGESHRGTMEQWLARPVSRARLLTERYIGGLLAVVLPVFLTSLTVPWLLDLVEETMYLDDLMRCSVHMSAFLAVVYSITFLWSTLGNEPLRISFVMMFGAILTFALYMVESVTDYSLYRLVDMNVFMDICLDDRIDFRFVGPMLAASVILYILSRRSFRVRVP